jgi:DNA-directed RNA polymerase subunit D
MTDPEKNILEEVGVYKMVSLKLLKKDKNFVSFILKDTNDATVNTIRRLVINEVPTLAIEDVKFIKNTSAMYDEYIAHRLGLLVLKTDLKSYNLPQECKCKGKGCAQCQLFFKLKAKGNSTVYAEELVSRDPKVSVVYPKTIILKLLQKQVLDIEAKAILGKGKDHMKFSPGVVYYQGVPEIKVNNCKLCKTCIDICPKKILKIVGNKINVTDNLKCDLCMACVEKCPNEAIQVKGSKKDFIVNIESFGQLTIKEMLTKAIDVFDEKLSEFSKLLKKI